MKSTDELIDELERDIIEDEADLLLMDALRHVGVEKPLPKDAGQVQLEGETQRKGTRLEILKSNRELTE